MKKEKKRKIPSGISGVAGEYFVAAELSRRGYLTTLTQRNSKGVDILVSSLDAMKSATIQVKTNQVDQDYWMLTAKAENLHAPRLFYVFVNLDTSSGAPEFHIVPSEVVAAYVKKNHGDWLKTPGKNGRPHQDNSMRQFHIKDSKYLNKWEVLDLDTPEE